jgi:tRNA(Arg) A34 adenosine deaminase TadA
MANHTKTSETRAPSWVNEHLEGLDLIDCQNKIEELESRLPGLCRAFEHLIERLPNPNRFGNKEFPIAASVVRLGSSGGLETLASFLNRTNELGDSTAHAEILAIQEAQRKTGEKHLPGCYLLTTLEPCTMCCVGAVHTELSGVIYGASHSDIEDKHALVGREYKPYRTSPLGFDALTTLRAYSSEIEIVSGYMANLVLEKMGRTLVNFREHYTDPDA